MAIIWDLLNQSVMKWILLQYLDIRQQLLRIKKIWLRRQMHGKPHQNLHLMIVQRMQLGR